MEAYAEPYCLGCVARFTQQRVPYMLKCCHLICSECLVARNLGPEGTCPFCNIPVEGTFAPALDVWDWIETMRKWKEDFPPSLWPTVNKNGLVCWAALAGTCPGGTCPFLHDRAPIEEVKKYRTGLLSTSPPTITSSGWRCRCDQEHPFNTTCDFCFQNFSLS